MTRGGTFENAVDFKFCPATTDIISFVKDGELYLYSRKAQTIIPLTNVKQGEAAFCLCVCMYVYVCACMCTCVRVHVCVRVCVSE